MFSENRQQKELKPRQRVLAAVSQLFHQQGYNSTGINQIVKESGVVKSSLYQNFRSKEEMAVAWLNERNIYWFDSLNEFIRSSADTKDRLMAAFDFISYLNEREDYKGCSFLNMLSEISSDNAAILKVIHQHKEDLRVFFQQMLDGTVLQENADHVYLLFEGATMESKLFRDSWPVNSAKSIINSLFN